MRLAALFYHQQEVYLLPQRDLGCVHLKLLRRARLWDEILSGTDTSHCLPLLLAFPSQAGSLAPSCAHAALLFFLPLEHVYVLLLLSRWSSPGVFSAVRHMGPQLHLLGFLIPPPSTRPGLQFPLETSQYLNILMITVIVESHCYYAISNLPKLQYFLNFVGRILALVL